MVPEAHNMAKTLLGTELGHNLQKFRLAGSNFGLSGLSYVTIRWLLPTAKTFTDSGLRAK